MACRIVLSKQTVQLKHYQQTALEQLQRWVAALEEAQEDAMRAAQGNEATMHALANFPRTAWEKLHRQGDVATADYVKRETASGRPIPHVCLKIPTGGGKTLLGVAALDRIVRNTGFVLWIVPTKAIYQQTLMALKTREHPYRQMLERMSGGKVKLLEKNSRFTKQDVENYLCIMMLMFPSANRQNNKEFLKINRDSGGYDSFFPEQDDLLANKKFLAEFRDLETSANSGVVMHSLTNVLKCIRPAVILDEAHKAYGQNNTVNKKFVKSVNRLNPRIVVELSATPKHDISNVLVNVSGRELQNEEMIKLPIQINNFPEGNWEHTLSQAKEKLAELAAEAERLNTTENRYVRPIAVVRVQRTGAAQRGVGFIHSEDARNYLIRNLNVPENQIRVQSSETRELDGEDLLSEMSQVRWIITKDALKEGWDCSFAYVLALLDNTTATTSVTQMVGRVMRQPHARRIENHEALNQCYIYCHNQQVGAMVDMVKRGLEKEGLNNLGNNILDGNDPTAAQRRAVGRRAKFNDVQIFLPQVLHKEGKTWRPLDHERDILGELNWASINAKQKVALGDGVNIEQQRVSVDLSGAKAPCRLEFTSAELPTIDYFVRRLIDIIPNPWQAVRIAEDFLGQYASEKQLKNRVYLSEELNKQVKAKVDAKAEALFRKKVKGNEIRFHLAIDNKLDYEIQNSVEVLIESNETTLQRQHAEELKRSLFAPVYAGGLNNLETDVALYLDGQQAIGWWYRVAAKQEYYLQGWRRHRVYPDLIACRQDNGRLFIWEVKGKHLAGNDDTMYKKKLLATLEKAYATAVDHGTMEFREPSPVYLNVLFENSWEQQINEALSDKS